MADPIFPVGLPGPEWSSMRWTPAFDPVLRTQFPGAQKARLRVSRVPERFNCTLWLTPAQLQVLLDFHAITCKWVLPFQWWDFRKPHDTDQRAVYTFVSKPTHTGVDDVYQVELELQIESTFAGTFPLVTDGGSFLTTDDDEALTT